MARGKHGDAAVRRLDHQARERIAELEQALRESRELHRREVAELKQALANTENRLVSEVNSMADELVRNVRRECAEQLAEEKRLKHERLGRLGMIIKQHNAGFPAAAWVEILSLFNAQPTDLFHESVEERRIQRRARRTKLLQSPDEIAIDSALRKRSTRRG